MSRVVAGRQAASIPDQGAVVFLIGMRINQWWMPWRWIPVLVAMPRMLVELMRNRDLGMVGRPRTFLSA